LAPVISHYFIDHIKIVFMQKNKIGLLLAAVAAYGAYKFSRMNPQQRTDLKSKGKQFIDKNLGGLGNLFGKKTTPVNGDGHA
jgi:hypothetical protein